MTTELKKFTEAYATITVASYQPLILQWYSVYGISTLAKDLARREGKSSKIQWDKALTTVHGLHSIARRQLPQIEKTKAGTKNSGHLKDVFGGILNNNDATPVKITGYPNAVKVGSKVYLHGVASYTETNQTTELKPGLFNNLRKKIFGTKKNVPTGNAEHMIRTMPSLMNTSLGYLEKDFDFRSTQAMVMEKLISAANEKTSDPSKTFEELLGKNYLDLAHDKQSYMLFPAKLEEALSPIGIAHFYRQYFFNINEGVGPIEEAFTVAPNETLEVVYESVRRQVQEETQEYGSEVVSEIAEEQKNTDEITDKVSTMIQRDASASMSANASGSIGVWQVGAETDASFSTTTNRGRETTTRNLREMTRRASERITKSYKLKTRTLEEFTTTNMTRRVISNTSNAPVSYGLRRVFQRANVKIQDLGPRLVWQLYIRNPGEGLARSRFVHFREAAPISVPEVPPGMDPRPTGGTDTGSTTSDIYWHSDLGLYVITISILPGPDRVVTGVVVDSMKDNEGGGKDDPEPAPLNDIRGAPIIDEDTNRYTVTIGVLPGDGWSVTANYTYSWEPDQHIFDEWEAKREQMVAELMETARQEQFEREKELITERSKIRARAANALRKEERYEILNRMISHLFARGDDPSNPTPLEIEYVHRFFDIQSLFVYTHPSWWQPRFAAEGGGFGREAYEVTAESEPAPVGKSLGWILQEDGDDRRNEFINSPWVRVCIPIKPTRERDALRWLARHVEGEIGYDETKDPLKTLIETLESIRTSETVPENIGPNYVTVDSSVGAPANPATPHETLYPIIDEFETTIPTDGFIYDDLQVTIP